MKDNTSLMDTLSKREEDYGSFQSSSRIAQSIKEIMTASPGWERTTQAQRESLQQMATKIARILNGNPFHQDSWLDIAGYAALIAGELLKEEGSNDQERRR